MYPVNRREQEVFITYSVCDFVVHSRAVAAYLKVVRRRKPSSAKGTRRGLFSLSLGGLGPPPRKFLNFERFYVRF